MSKLSLFFRPNFLAFMICLMIGTSCVDPYLERFSVDRTIFIVDGILSNDLSGNFVKLLESIPIENGNNTIYTPVENANVKVVINRSDAVHLIETEKGYYSFPDGFKGEIGNSYQLQFQTSEGNYFESTIETMVSSPEIKKVYHDFSAEAIQTATETSPGQIIFLDTQDPLEEENNYMWKWDLYEQQFYCKTCYNTIYFNDESTDPLGECRGTFGSVNGWDYSCQTPCWDIISSRKTNIMNDQFINGNEIKGMKIAEIPIYQKIGSLLEIRQYGISQSVYDFLNLVSTQGEKTGGLADTPPATLSGNISNPNNPDQPVAGYFIVASVSKVSYWLDKIDVPNNIQSVGLLDGRKIELEPSSLDTKRPPMAPCINSQFRTSNRPTGWQTADGV